MSGERISFEGVARRYGDTEALRGVDVTVAGGSWLSLVGPSGSGKSTLLHLLGAMDTPSAGRILVSDTDLASLDPNAATRFRRERVGFVFQQHHMVPYLSALENVMLAQWIHSAADAEEAEAALARVGLAHRAGHLPSQLSGGERQRACIARALVNEPGLLLLDEPTGALDWASALQVLELLAALHRESGFTIVCATHNPAVARWGDRIVTLRDGRIVSDEAIVPERTSSAVASG